MKARRSRAWVGAPLCLLPGVTSAHSFSTPYVLPIPFWIYLYGCAATLVVTFAVLGFFASEPAAARGAEAPDATPARVRALPWPWVLPLLRAGAAVCLLLTVVSGLVGIDDPGRNIGMTLFWVIFLLAFAYVTIVIGDLYALINPWKAMLGALEHAGIDLSRGRLPYPEWLGKWPAVFFYIALIWIELFVEQRPLTLSVVLLMYSMLTLVGVVVFGKVIWFSRVDVFTHYFGVIGRLAPVEYVETQGGQGIRLRLRAPFSALVHERPEHLALVLFVLFMLSSTAYDAIYDSQLWTALFWRNAMIVLQPLWGSDLAKAQTLLMSAFLVYRKVGLLIFPFLYLGVYFLALFFAKALTRSTVSSRSLALSFCYSLIAIAVAYNFSHYYTFVVAQLRMLPWLVSDPFGLGWNILGLAGPKDQPLQMGIIWHTQVIVILIGHVVGVVVSHRVATRVFASRRAVLASQLPLLILMVGYTMLGLWILTLPLG